jgi:ElaB/YqjD/DUF883 family membrane-anchored ribosome-binding protein
MASNDNKSEAAPGRRARGAAGALEAARERTTSAYEAARSRANDVTRQASEQMAVYPVAAVLGGFAVGALLATLLPRTAREDRVLGKAGRRLAGAARDVAQKGFDAGKDQIDELRAKAARKVGEAVVDAVGGKP